MIPSVDLPVWTIRPNWRAGILERLLWHCAILDGDNGTEQAISRRLSPRREFEMTFNPVAAVRSYFDLWLHRFGSGEFMIPLYHDAAKLTAEIGVGDTVIPLDTTYREFVAGDLAVLIGDGPFEYDRVTVVAVNPGSIEVEADEITRTWFKGAVIHPLRRCRLSDESKIAVLTNRVAEGQIQFQLNQANDIPDIGEWAGLIDGLPIITTRPNYRENLDMSFLRKRLVLDNEDGLTEVEDTAGGRAFTLQLHSFMLKGRAEQWAFRQMLYRLGGRAGAAWLPTYNEDIVLARAAEATDTTLDIRKIGYELTGGAVAGRNRLLIGDSFITIEGTLAALDAAEERLDILTPIGTDYPAGTIGSFADTCRLSSDVIEITHHTDTDGAAECNISFQAFNNERTAPEPIHYPIETAIARTYSCGTEPTDWYWRTVITTDSPDPWADEGYSPAQFAAFVSPVTVTFPNGKTITAGQYIFGNISDDPYEDETPGLPMVEVKRELGRVEVTVYYEIPRPFYHNMTVQWQWGSFRGDGSLGSAYATMTGQWAGEEPFVVREQWVGEVFQQYFRMDVE